MSDNSMTFRLILNQSKKFQPLEMINISGRRYYVSRDGKIYPSVTTVLSVMDNQGIEAWKKRVGPAVAKADALRGAIRGSSFHLICEDYLRNKNVDMHKNKILPKALFELARPEIDKIDNILALETALCSEQLCIAGKPDCIGEYEGVLSVVDFKTATRKKKIEWVGNYFLQETAYSLVWEDVTGIPIGQIVTIVACEDGSLQTFVEHRDKFVTKLNYYIKKFTQLYGSAILEYSNARKRGMQK